MRQITAKCDYWDEDGFNCTVEDAPCHCPSCKKDWCMDHADKDVDCDGTSFSCPECHAPVDFWHDIAFPWFVTPKEVKSWGKLPGVVHEDFLS